jgi:hypothetical protein
VVPYSFAGAFNGKDLPEKLVTVEFDDDDEVTGLLHLEDPSPRVEMFGINPIQCFPSDTFTVVRPGYVQVPEDEYASLRDMAVMQMRSATKGRRAAEQRKLEKHAAEEAAAQRKHLPRGSGLLYAPKPKAESSKGKSKAV